MNFEELKIILGITGSIAAYKAPMIAREFIKLGAEVRIVATPAATNFVSVMVLEELTHYPVITDMFDSRMYTQGAWHVDTSHWCDAMLIAPCSATTLSKLATGNCDNALSCVAAALPKNKPLLIAPAMDYTMYAYPATQNNIRILESFGATIIEPAEGALASGLTGKGRLPEIQELIVATHNAALSTKTLDGIRMLITAGPTQEKIDDVRYISNYSTGKMGYAIANTASQMGANVTLITGPTSLPLPQVSKVINVVTAEEMFNAVKEEYKEQDIIIMSAAVADFTPEIAYKGKIKKIDVGNNYSIKLNPTTDILKFLGNNINRTKTTLVGFALEAENELENAKNKLKDKKCDMIILNSANKPNSGFGGDMNTITIITKDEVLAFEAMTKSECAKVIIKNLPIIV